MSANTTSHMSNFTSPRLILRSSYSWIKVESAIQNTRGGRFSPCSQPWSLLDNHCSTQTEAPASCAAPQTSLPWLLSCHTHPGMNPRDTSDQHVHHCRKPRHPEPSHLLAWRDLCWEVPCFYLRIIADHCLVILPSGPFLDGCDCMIAWQNVMIKCQAHVFRD